MGEKYALEIEAELTNLEDIRRFVERSALSLRAGERVISDLKLAVDEAVTNIIFHGYEKSHGTVKISVERNADALIVCLRDSAPQFDPSKYISSDLPLSEREAPGGFGIRLIKDVMDEISYRVPGSGGNELTLIKHDVIR